MPEVLFQLNENLAFEKTVYKNGRCKVELRSTDSAHNLYSITYRFKNIPIFQSPYLNWGNLAYVASRFDDPYLFTAVQQGKKLFADIVFTMYDEDWAKECYPAHNLTTQKDIEAIIEKIKSELPPDCTFGVSPNDQQRYRCKLRGAFICKNGTISDFIDVAQILLAYEQLGIGISNADSRHIWSFCQIPLVDFSGEDAPFDIFNAQGGVELTVTGLLLGYPIESTAWLIERDGLFPVKK